MDAAGRLLYPSASLPASYRDGDGRELGTWLGVCRWVDDAIPFPGAALRQWIRDFYQGNRLARGGLELGGRRVDLGRIACPVLALAGSLDWVAPLAQARPAVELVGSAERELAVVEAGHVGLVVGEPARRETWPRIAAWLAAHAGR